jgi:hypothetical protein
MDQTQPTVKKIQRFVDTRYCAISKEQMVAYLCRLWRIEHTRENIDKIVLPIPNKVGLTAADLVYRKGPPNWAVLKKIKDLSQDDPLWHLARVQPRLKTASILNNALCMSDPSVASKLKVSPFMVAKHPTNQHWDDFMQRDLHPTLPKPPLDSLMGSVFTTLGKEHETNVHTTFCTRNPHLRSREQGLTYLTPEMLENYPMHNKLTGELFDYETLLSKLMFAASPDTVFTDINTGEQFNGEWKAATNWFPLHGKDTRPGVDFWLNQKSKPYEYIRSYYVPQAQLQLLVCENEISYWGCWTLANGMRTWVIKKNRLYLELMFTILVYIWDNFASVQKQLPLDYFELVKDTPIGRLHKQFVDLNVRIITMKEPTIAYEHEFYTDTLAITNRVFGIPEGVFARSREIYFPDIPPEVPAYAGIGLALYELLQPDSKGLANWTDDPRNMHVRCINLTEIMSMDRLRFLKEVVETNILVGKQPTGLDADKAITTHDNVCMYRLDRAERFMLAAALTLYKLDKRILLPDSLMMEMGILGPDATLVHRILKEMNAMEQSVRMIQLDTTYGIHPPTVMFDMMHTTLNAWNILECAKLTPENVTRLVSMFHVVWSYYRAVWNKADSRAIESAPKQEMEQETNTITYIENIMEDNKTRDGMLCSILEPAAGGSPMTTTPSAYLVVDEPADAADNHKRPHSPSLDEEDEQPKTRSRVGMLSPATYTVSILTNLVEELPPAAVIDEDDLHVADLTEGEDEDMPALEQRVWLIVRINNLGGRFGPTAMCSGAYTNYGDAEKDAKAAIVEILADCMSNHQIVINDGDELASIITPPPPPNCANDDLKAWLNASLQQFTMERARNVFNSFSHITGSKIGIHEF